MEKSQNTGWTVPKGEGTGMGVLAGLGVEGQVINLGWEPRGGGPCAALVSREHGCTLATNPDPTNYSRGFLTGCLGDRRRNHGAWGLERLAVPGSCFGV